jgi:hypothetical protein
MFNDDVQAICPVCNGRTVTYDATKIACLDCKFEEAFGISSDTPSTSVKALSRIRWLLFYSGGNSLVSNFEAWGLRRHSYL